jgi:hypothetical protein
VPSATAPPTAPPASPSPSPVPIDIAATATKPGEGDLPLILVYEAEAARLRQADVVQLGDGAAVHFTSPSGEIEYESLDVPTRDRYRVTIVYAAEGDWSVDVRGSANSERVQLNPNSGCCASVTVDLRLSPGGDVTIEPSRGDGPLPTIDRILIERV